MEEKILILDFGSQYTQLIARRIRELNIYCEIFPYNKIPKITKNYLGVILSGSPFSVHDNNAPIIEFNLLENLPILGICYGAQLIAQNNNCEITSWKHRNKNLVVNSMPINQNGQCREFITSVQVESRLREMRGTACLNNGEWELKEIY